MVLDLDQQQPGLADRLAILAEVQTTRAHRLTHPILGPITWYQLTAYVCSLKKDLNRRACWWCWGEVPGGRRTRCNSGECQRAIDELSSWSLCARRAMHRAAATCALCKQPADDIDHIVPVSLGGTGDHDNLRALCHACHNLETARLRSEGSAFVARVAVGGTS